MCTVCREACTRVGVIRETRLRHSVVGCVPQLLPMHAHSSAAERGGYWLRSYFFFSYIGAGNSQRGKGIYVISSLDNSTLREQILR